MVETRMTEPLVQAMDSDNLCLMSSNIAGFPCSATAIQSVSLSLATAGLGLCMAVFLVMRVSGFVSWMKMNSNSFLLNYSG